MDKLLKPENIKTLKANFLLEYEAARSERKNRNLRALESATKALKGIRGKELGMATNETLVIRLDVHGNMNAAVIKDAAPMTPTGYSVRRDAFANLILEAGKVAADKRDEDQKALCQWAQAAYTGKSFAQVAEILMEHAGKKNGKTKKDD